MKKTAALLLLLLSFSLNSEEKISIDYREDWLKGELVMDISVELPSGEMKPTNRFVAEQTIEAEASSLITNALKELIVDSWDSIGSLYYKDTEFYRELEDLISSQNKVFSKTTQDMKSFIVRYRLPFYPDLISLLIAHERSVTPDYLNSLGRTSEEFTGLVVYAGDAVPYHGTKESTQLKPALFPSFYDEDMNLIFDKTFVAPEALNKWGMVQYSDEIPATFLATEERVGMKPIKVSLREVYGKNSCDLILSREDGLLILSSTELSNWLKEGRVLVIVDR